MVHVLEGLVFPNMQRLLEMSTVVIEERRFRRPQQSQAEPCYGLQPDLRRTACHEINCRRQGRPTASVRVQGLMRTQVNSTQQDEKRTPLIASYPIMGNNTVEAVLYTEPKQSADKGLVWINAKQYFKGVPPEVWNFCLGGCQICQKWLKDREGRNLSNTDIRQYQRIVMALKEMIELMAGIDAMLQHGQLGEEKLSIAAQN